MVHNLFNHSIYVYGHPVIKKTWQIWSVFSLCLALVVLAMVWLSSAAVQIEKAREQDRIETELARREAELLERISSAMYRMDWMLSPLVAQEAARPSYYYKSFFRESTPSFNPDGTQEQVSLVQASPLLFQPSEFVVLHFQVNSNGTYSSPQTPTGAQATQAISLFDIDQATLDANLAKLKMAERHFKYQTIVAVCPEAKLPAIPLPNFNFKGMAGNQSVYASPIVQDVAEQQMEAQQLQQFSPQQVDNNILAQQKNRIQNRGTSEFLERRNSTENVGLSQLAMNNGYRGNSPPKPGFEVPPNTIAEGVMSPIWINDNLILARRVEDRGETLIQCCWLDWEKIQAELKTRVNDLLSDVEFQRIENELELNPAIALATLPVQLIVDNKKMLANLAFEPQPAMNNSTSGLRLTLFLAWCGLGIAALAIAIMLHGVVRLSERRATFVSAVTHELRTPLTTFRMYAEMLAEKMVPAEKQQQYAQTLKVQADRLSHLVENVLQFAKLERGPGNEAMETIDVNELFDRMNSRMEERADEASMQFSLHLEAAVAKRQITTRPSLVEQILFNLVDNACKYAKPSEDNRIQVTCRESSGRLFVSVRDFGPGVSRKILSRMFLPFCKSDQDAANSAPGVGLGLALCRRMAGSLGGRLTYSAHTSDDGGGAEFIVELPMS